MAPNAAAEARQRRAPRGGIGGGEMEMEMEMEMGAGPTRPLLVMVGH
jgi:hypothetical protein